MSASIEVVPYRDHWPADYSREAERILPAFGGCLIELHHIGSTSVPGLSAKPIIDMLAIVSDVPLLDKQAAHFEALGYEVKGEFGLPGRRYFRRDDSSGVRTHHLHAFAPQSSTEIDRHLGFRDYLRAHPDIAQAYGKLKQQLAERCQGDMTCYSEGKTDFIREIEQRATR